MDWSLPGSSGLWNFPGKNTGVYAAATAKSLQSCLTLWDPRDGSPPGSAIPGILQARTLEWVAISFSNASKWKVKVKSPSRVRLLATPWTVAYQAPPSMGFSRQEYWSGVPSPSAHPKCLLNTVKVGRSPLWRKDREILPAPSALSPAGRAMASAAHLVKNHFLVCYSPVGLMHTSSVGF